MLLRKKYPLLLIQLKKPDYDAKTSDIERKYFTYYCNFTSDAIVANLKNKELVNESDTSGFINNSDLTDKKDKKISNISKVKSLARLNI